MKGQCEQLKANGGRCKAKALPGSDYCVFHNPEQAEARADGRRRGGLSRSRKAAVLTPDTPDAPLGTMQEVVAFLGATANRVAKGVLDVKVGNCLALLCGQLVRALEKGNLEARLEALEAVLKQRTGGGKP